MYINSNRQCVTTCAALMLCPLLLLSYPRPYLLFISFWIVISLIICRCSCINFKTSSKTWRFISRRNRWSIPNYCRSTKSNGNWTSCFFFNHLCSRWTICWSDGPSEYNDSIIQVLGRYLIDTLLLIIDHFSMSMCIFCQESMVISRGMMMCTCN